MKKMFDVVSFAGPTTFYVVSSHRTKEEAIAVAMEMSTGYGLQVENNGRVVWSSPGPCN